MVLRWSEFGSVVTGRVFKRRERGGGKHCSHISERDSKENSYGIGGIEEDVGIRWRREEEIGARDARDSTPHSRRDQGNERLLRRHRKWLHGKHILGGSTQDFCGWLHNSMVTIKYAYEYFQLFNFRKLINHLNCVAVRRESSIRSNNGEICSRRWRVWTRRLLQRYNRPSSKLFFFCFCLAHGMTMLSCYSLFALIILQRKHKHKWGKAWRVHLYFFECGLRD